MKLKNKLLLGGLTAVLLAVMSFSAWKIWVIRSEYHTGEAAYEDISHMISLPQKTAEPQPPVINKPAGAETLPDEDDTVWPEVDFAALREINPDIVAWIYIEGTKINYPIVQGEENSYYLKHLFSGEWNGSGCIFLDFRNDASFADRHSIIYGHQILACCREGHLWKSILVIAFMCIFRFNKPTTSLIIILPTIQPERVQVGLLKLMQTSILMDQQQNG